MTGPEHYREAERLVEQSVSLMEQAVERGDQESGTVALRAVPLTMQRAQVHATLALTAAVALFDDEDCDWKQAMS